MTDKQMLEEYRLPHNNLFILGLLLWIVFLIVELFIRMFNLYEIKPWVDIPSHFLSGMATAVIGFWILSLTATKGKRFKTVVFVFVIAAIWEILESFEDYFISNPPYLKDYFLWDGLGDIVTGVIGGIVGIGLLLLIKKKTHFLHGIKI